MKIAGATVILCGAFRVWIICRRERKNKYALLAHLRLILFRMGEEIRQLRTPFPHLLERMAEDCPDDAGTFLKTALTLTRQGENLYTAWKTAAETLPLERTEKQIIMQLAEEFRGDAERIDKAFVTASETLGNVLARLEAGEQNEMRQMTAFIFSAALLLVILLY